MLWNSSRSLDWRMLRTPRSPWVLHVRLTPGDQILCRSMIRSIFYLTTSRLDIMLCICICARFQASTMESHLKAVKKIIKYIKHSTNFKQVHFDLSACTDLDFVGSKSDRKNTSGACFFLRSCCVPWMDLDVWKSFRWSILSSTLD